MCGEDLFELRGAQTEGDRTEGAVGRGVRVGHRDDHARLRDAELGADHMHDALLRMIEIVIAVDIVGRHVFGE